MTYRAFMCDTAITPLAQLAADMEAWKRPDIQVLPDECRLSAPSHLDDHVGRKHPGEGPPGPSRNPAQFGNPAADNLGALMLALAKPKTSKDLKISVLLPTNGDIDCVIGLEFLGVRVPRGKPLCWRHHICGACREGNGCCYAHTFRTRPSLQLIDGITRRMQQRLHDIVAQHPK
jgi:hypothetical protein